MSAARELPPSDGGRSRRNLWVGFGLAGWFVVVAAAVAVYLIRSG